MARHLPGLVQQSAKLWTLLTGATVLMLLGLFDDRRGLDWRLRLAVQTAVALAMVLLGWRVSLFVDAPLLMGTLSVLWIVGLVNSFNMLDNMDGLSAGVALIVTAILGVVAIQSEQLFIAALLAPLAGALAGFLLFNYPPASIYMGDAGSLSVGFLLSVIAVLLTFHEGSGSLRPVVLPLLVFSVGGVLSFDAVTDAIDEVVDKMHPVIALQTLILKSGIPVHDYIIHGDPAAHEIYTRISGKVDSSFELALKVPYDLSEEQRRFLALRMQWESSKKISREIFSMPAPLEGNVVEDKMELLEEYIDEAESILDQIHEIIMGEMNDLMQYSSIIERRVTIFITSIIALGLAIAISVSLLLTLKNGSKIFSFKISCIPGPLSLTVNIHVSSIREDSTLIHLPSAAYFSTLLIRLLRICSRISVSSRTTLLLLKSRVHFIFLAFRAGLKLSATDLIISSGTAFTGLNWIPFF